MAAELDWDSCRETTKDQRIVATLIDDVLRLYRINPFLATTMKR